MKSYRCFKCFMQDTQAIRITDTIEWLPDRLPIPTPSTDDLIIAGIHDIKYALLHPSAHSTLQPLQPSTVAALHALNNILHNVAIPPPATIARQATSPSDASRDNIAEPLRVPTVSVPASLYTVTPAPLRVDAKPKSYGVPTNRRQRRRTARQTRRKAQLILDAVTPVPALSLVPPVPILPTIPAVPILPIVSMVPIPPLVIPVLKATRPRRSAHLTRYNKRTHQPEFAACASTTSCL